MTSHASPNAEGPSTRTHVPTALGEGGDHPPPSSRRHLASSLRLLPPTYVAITADQEARAIEALAGLLADADRHNADRRNPDRAISITRAGRTRPTPSGRAP